jgi:tetratricopeptide (TPR) repeat protein
MIFLKEFFCMFSSMKWISKLTIVLCVTFVVTSSAWAQIHVLVQANSLLPADEAREIFNNGVTLYDQYRFNDAEIRFREVIRRFPKNVIADRADYYLIRTLAQVRKTTEALSRIDAFAKQYPKSKWLDDVQELQIQLTNQIPPKADSIFLRSSASPSPAPAPLGTRVQITTSAVPALPPFPPLPPGPPSPFGPGFQSSDPEVSLQQEIMAAYFRTNFDRALEIAADRLKANPADPVVLSSLHLVASSRSAPALSMLLGIVKDSPNPKARRDAIFWLAQSRGDREAIVDTLIGLLPSLADDDSEALVYSLSQIRTDKSLNALTTLARDKNKSEKVRTSAVFSIGQSRAPNRVGLLDDIYKGSMDNSKIRQQIVFALGQTRDPAAVTIIGNVALTDPDIEVRKQAVFLLGQSGTPEASQALEKLLRKK